MSGIATLAYFGSFRDAIVRGHCLPSASLLSAETISGSYNSPLLSHSNFRAASDETPRWHPYIARAVTGPVAPRRRPDSILETAVPRLARNGLGRERRPQFNRDRSARHGGRRHENTRGILLIRAVLSARLVSPFRAYENHGQEDEEQSGRAEPARAANGPRPLHGGELRNAAGETPPLPGKLITAHARWQCRPNKTSANSALGTYQPEGRITILK